MGAESFHQKSPPFDGGPDPPFSCGEETEPRLAFQEIERAHCCWKVMLTHIGALPTAREEGSTGTRRDLGSVPVGGSRSGSPWVEWVPVVSKRVRLGSVDDVCAPSTSMNQWGIRGYPATLRSAVKLTGYAAVSYVSNRT